MNRSLVPYYVESHAEGQYPGYSLSPYKDRLGAIVRRTGTRTILDYGCGKGWQYTKERYHADWGVECPSLFDPAVAELNVLPDGKFDGVICSDVLEHIPKEELDEVIDELVARARLWCFISVCCRAADCRLSNGMNEHVTLRHPVWWREKLSKAFAGKAQLFLEFTP